MNIIQKIKMLLKLNSAVNEIKGDKNMKSGFRTSEFWLSLLTGILSIFGAVQGFIPTELTVKIVAAIVMVYTIARTIVKYTKTDLDDKVLGKVESILKDKKIIN